MSPQFVFLAMLFCHVFDDYTLQGILAQMKQESWWKNQKEYKPKYRNDYYAALVCHAVSWAFCIMLPVAAYLHFNVNDTFVWTFAVNVVVHAIVDDMKANLKTINLVQDQLVHLAQILATFIIFLLALA